MSSFEGTNEIILPQTRPRLKFFLPLVATILQSTLTVEAAIGV